MKKGICVFIPIIAVMVLLILCMAGICYAWISPAKKNDVDLDIGGGYKSLYFDERSGNGLSPVFTGEVDENGKLVGPYILARPEHLYNLAVLQSDANDTTIVDGSHYHFQLGLPYDSGGNLLLDANGYPNYDTENANLSEYKVYADDFTSTAGDTMDMSGYEGDYALMPIGTTGHTFQSNFYGNDIVIENLNVTAEAGEHAGMFGYVENYGTLQAPIRPVIKNFTLANPTINVVEPATAGVTGPYAGYLIGYLYGGDVSGLGVYNGNMTVDLESGTGSGVYTSEYGYIGRSTVPIFSGSGGSGDMIDANLDFEKMADNMTYVYDFARRQENGAFAVFNVSPFGCGTTVFDDLIPTTVSNKIYNRDVFDISGSCQLYRKNASEYTTYTAALIDSGGNDIPVPFYRGSTPTQSDNASIAADPDSDDPNDLFYLTKDMVTGLWGYGDAQTFTFTTTGGGDFYFAYSLTTAAERVTVNIYNTASPNTAVASFARDVNVGGVEDVFARALTIPSEGTYNVVVQSSRILYIRFKMHHILGNLGEDGVVSNIDYTYAVNGDYAKVVSDTTLYTNSGAWLKFDLIGTGSGEYVFNVTRNSSAIDVTCVTNISSTVTTSRGTVTVTAPS